MFLAVPAAFLSAVILFASVDAGRLCSSGKFGDVSGRMLQLPPIPLPDKSNHVFVADTCYTLGPRFRSVGIKVVACDRWKPLVRVKKIDRAWVRLVGISRTAMAYITQYCKPFPIYADSEEYEDVPDSAVDPAPADHYDD